MTKCKLLFLVTVVVLSLDIAQTSSAIGICKLLVETQGFGCQEHTVTTKDGYILSMQRISSGGSGAKSRAPKIPVLLQHGLLGDASTWLSNSPEESLGFILANNGYDVWLANVRGTIYSSGHTSLSPNDAAYWNWSWDELVAYDLPAMFQHVHEQTKQKLHYVGHSLGTLMAFGAFSKPPLMAFGAFSKPPLMAFGAFSKQEVLSMVRSAALLSPIAYMGQMPSPLARAAADAFLADEFYWLGVKKFDPRGGPVFKLVSDICRSHIINCNDLRSIITGPNCCLNTTKSNLGSQEPTSTKNLVHISQMIIKGTIQMFDYGCGNIMHYGQMIPPAYDIASIPNDLPLFLAYGGQDLLSDVKDVNTLIYSLSLSGHDPDKLVKLCREDYAHMDFVGGVNANEVVYNPIMDFFRLN